MIHTYNITGMTCNGCVAKVKSELLKLGDITSVEVQLQSPQATITMQKHIPTAMLQEAVSKAGKYTIADDNAAMIHSSAVSADDKPTSYYPIFLIFGYITGATLLVQYANGEFMWMHWMSHFMAGFFLVFSFFKLLNLNGFADGYSTYDIVAKRFRAYGFIYPFIELGLGIAFLLQWQSLPVSIITLVIMSISTIGVLQSIMKKTQFQCACLGTVIQLPLSKVTLFEDLLMVAMSAAMLINLL